MEYDVIENQCLEIFSKIVVLERMNIAGSSHYFWITPTNYILYIIHYHADRVREIGESEEQAFFCLFGWVKKKIAWIPKVSYRNMSLNIYYLARISIIVYPCNIFNFISARNLVACE